MRAQITISEDVDFDKIKIGKRYTLEDIFSIIQQSAEECVMDISIQNQQEIPNYEDIDTPIHRILNLLEEINFK